MEKRNLGKSDFWFHSSDWDAIILARLLMRRRRARSSTKRLTSASPFSIPLTFYGKKGGSETILGQLLGERRKNIVLATKFGLPWTDAETLKGASRRYIFSAIEASLRRLKTDWIDLYQIHQVDPLTPMEETLRALDDLVHQGKVRYIGISNHPAWKVADADCISRHSGLAAYISCQDEYSLLVREPRTGADSHDGSARARHASVFSPRIGLAVREIQAKSPAGRHSLGNRSFCPSIHHRIEFSEGRASR